MEAYVLEKFEMGFHVQDSNLLYNFALAMAYHLVLCKTEFLKKFRLCNPPQPALIVPFWFNITSLVFFYLSKQLF